MTARICAECSELFEATRSDARFCSSTCRSRSRRRTADVEVRIRSVKRELTALADVAAALSVGDWATVWGDVAAHIRAEFKRIGLEKEATP